MTIRLTQRQLRTLIKETMMEPQHGSFESLPVPEENTTLGDVMDRYPEAFAEEGAPTHMSPDSPVELETSTGAMTVYPGGVEQGENWVYFPGEGWDGY